MNAHLSSPETICLQCGDRGFTNAFVYCLRCLDVAVHRYCLDVIPKTLDEFVPWVCEECDVEVQNQPAVCKHDSTPCQTRDSATSEHILGYSEVETTKNDIVAVNIEDPVNEDGPYVAGVELRLVECAESACESRPRATNDELVVLASPSERKRCEESSFEHLEEGEVELRLVECADSAFESRPRAMNDELVVLASPSKRKRCEESSFPHLEERKFELRLVECAESQSAFESHPSAMNDELVVLPSPSERKRCEESDFEHLEEGEVELRLVECAESVCESRSRAMNDEHVFLASPSERKRCEESSFEHLEDRELMQHDKLSVDTPLKESTMQGRGAIRESTVQEDQHGLGNNSSEGPHEQCTDIDVSECAELMSDAKLSKEVREVELLELEKECSDMSIEEIGINENGRSEVSEEITSASHNMSNLCKESSKVTDGSLRNECHIRAQPVITPVWRGSFSIWNRNGDILDELVAHMSNRACPKVYEEACLFEPMLHLEILPKYDVWPKRFEISDPVENIALYFFPCEIRSERFFEYLVDEMVNKVLAMRAVVQNAELLVFTSTELSMPYWRFQDKYYLWGVFRQKQHPAPVSQPYRGESRCNYVPTAERPDDTGFSDERVATRDPVEYILGENRLKGPNYADWKRNINNLLTDKKLIHVLNEEPPELPADDASQDVKDAYKLWFKHESHARCYILASLETTFQRQYEFSTTAKDMMASLKEMFEQQNSSAIQNAMRRLICSRMINGAPIHDHVAKMIGHINELEMLGAEMDKGLKMEEILSSLPNAFVQFVLNVDKKNLVMTLFELRNMLQRTKDWIKNDKPVVTLSEVAQAPKPKSSKRKREAAQTPKPNASKRKKEAAQTPKPNSSKKKNKAKNKKNPKQVVFKKSGKDKSDQSCFHCGKRGHWKRNCREYLASVKTY